MLGAGKEFGGNGMKQNKYDDDIFFVKYKSMRRSADGLEGAGEWHELVRLLPDFRGKRVLDLGCGFGWHCQYAIENGAKSVIGVDISEKMLREARNRTSQRIEYICAPMEDIGFPSDSFDVLISSLALHYVQSFEAIASRVAGWLSRHGDFVFSAGIRFSRRTGPRIGTMMPRATGYTGQLTSTLRKASVKRDSSARK